MLSEEDSEVTDQIYVICDIIPMSRGFASGSGLCMKTYFPRNTTIPCSRTRNFTTYMDNQPSIDIEIFEGESQMIKHNHLLGSFNIDRIPPASRGILQIIVTFHIDANGILNVSAVEKATGKSMKTTIRNNTGRLS